MFVALLFFFPKKRSRKGLLPQNFNRKERNTKEKEGDIGPKPPKNCIENWGHFEKKQPAQKS